MNGGAVLRAAFSLSVSIGSFRADKVECIVESIRQQLDSDIHVGALHARQHERFGSRTSSRPVYLP